MIKDLTSFISGICLIILSAVLFHEANQLSPFASVFPYAITSVLLLLSVLLIRAIDFFIPLTYLALQFGVFDIYLTVWYYNWEKKDG